MKTKLLGAFALAALATTAVVLGFSGTAKAAPGDLVGSVTFSQECQSGIGVGIAYDGQYLWVSCYASNPDLLRADPITGNVSATYNIAGGLGSLAYDATRNALWAGWGNGTDAAAGNVRLISLDAAHNALGGPVQFAAPAALTGCGLDDGMGYDATDDSLYISDDCSTTVWHYTTAGTLLTSFPWSGSGCFNSGVAIGGNLLFEGSDGCSHVWVVDKTTLAPAFDFTTVVAGDPNFRDEGLSCDPLTFASVGKQVMWSKEAYPPNRAHAFEIPPNTCGVGGQPPPNRCELSQGFWKTHPDAWPVTSLTLGSQTYTQAELLAILNTPVKGDASLILADQLIAAKLNIANGSNPTPIGPTIADADALLSAFSGKLPYHVSPSTATGQQMVADAGILDNYNNQVLTPDCTT